MAIKYYAVKVGKIPGIYLDWEECKEQVAGFSGAVYKSFKTKEEALEFLGQGIEENPEENSTPDTEEGLSAYVDGSFLSGDEFGCGCVLLWKGEVIGTISKKFQDADLAQMRNVAGEIKASELAMQYAKDGGYQKITIYHDYEGIAKWCLREWKANKEGTLSYRNFYDTISKEIRVAFKKVKGHSGNQYNDMADRLAKSAIGV